MGVVCGTLGNQSECSAVFAGVFNRVTYDVSHRSDGNGGSEQHLENYCVGSSPPDGRLNDGSTVTGTPMCERDVSEAQCPPGWLYYTDYDGSEGQDSCVRLFAGVTGWATASTSCPLGSHLLTSSTGSAQAGIIRYTSSIRRTNLYVGCSQASDATDIISGWSWVDGTASSNLNCGASGCGIWGEGEPK